MIEMAITLISLFSGLAAFLLVVGIVYIVFSAGRMLFGVVINVVLGFMGLFLIGTFTGLSIPFDTASIIITAITGLPGVVAIILLKLLGVSV